MIQTLENFLRPYVERHPQTWRQYLALAEFAANNAINVAAEYCRTMADHRFFFILFAPIHSVDLLSLAR